MGPKMPYFGILANKFESPLLYLKSAVSNLSKCECKNKNPK